MHNKKRFIMPMILLVCLILLVMSGCYVRYVPEHEEITGGTLSFVKTNESGIYTALTGEKTMMSDLAEKEIWVTVEVEGSSIAEEFLLQSDYGSIRDFISSEEGAALIYERQVLQNEVIDLIKNRDIGIEFKQSYTTLLNGFSAKIKAGDLATLRAMPYVTEVTVSEFYSMPESTITADVTGNWYFMIASTFLVTIVIALVSEKLVAPRFGIYTGNTDEGKIQLTPQEHKGLRAAGITTLAFLALVLISFFTGLTSGEDGAFIGSPLLKNITVVLFLWAAAAGLAFGFASGKFRNSHDVNASMVNATKTLASFILFCFICGQFSGLFSWSNLGTLLAIGGANFLQSINFTGMGMCVVFILISALVNILVYSGSAKWAIFAPVFVPMFMMLGYHPSFAQLLYRLGDSPVDCLTPMCPYIWMLLETARTKYDSNLKIGTVVASMVPIAVILQVVWILFLLLWMALDLPIGPGVFINLP